MPTPSDGTHDATLLDIETEARTAHTTCPPEDSRFEARIRQESDESHNALTLTVATQQPTPPAERDRTDGPKDDGSRSERSDVHQIESVEDSFTTDSMVVLTPMSDIKEGHGMLSDDIMITPIDASREPSLRWEFSSLRLLPTSCTSYLRAGSKFRGTQRSDHQVYEVQVDLKYVDMRESFLCGYLRIQGLTANHPTLTTYFEGEIVGNKYAFQTRHPEWGSNEKVDMQHWSKFHAWRPFAKQAKKENFRLPNYTQKENVFMRWKEQFLVPDHTVRTISGASFEGFYYICFNQVAGNITGIYFHAKSEKYQQLDLAHVEDRGRIGAMEFR